MFCDTNYVKGKQSRSIGGDNMTKQEYEEYIDTIDEETFIRYSEEIEAELARIFEADGESPWDDDTFYNCI